MTKLFWLPEKIFSRGKCDNSAKYIVDIYINNTMRRIEKYTIRHFRDSKDAAAFGHQGSDTTGNRRFAECLRHSGKALPSAALGKAHTVKKKVSAKTALPSVFYRAPLGKVQNEKISKKIAKKNLLGWPPSKLQVTAFFA
jgi:hypothetical protein